MTPAHPIEPPIRRAVSRQPSPHDAVKELADQLHHKDLSFVLFFCASSYDRDALASAMNASFGDIAVCGCTSAGEITDQGYDQNTLVAIGFLRPAFAVSTELIEDMQGFDLAAAQQLSETLRWSCQRDIKQDGGHHEAFVFTLLDGLSIDEEVVIATLNTALGSIPSFGGSAGESQRQDVTYVFHDGAFHTNAAVVIMMSTALEFQVFSHHHLHPSDKKLVITDADPARRTVSELNGEAAATVYARSLGKPLDTLNTISFAHYPLGVRIHDHCYPRSIQRLNEDLSLTFHCAVDTGVVLTTMSPEPMPAHLQGVLCDLEQQLGDTWLILGCDCYLRRAEAESLNQHEDCSALFRQFGVTGFNTYGEQYRGMHLNQTFTGVAIGQRYRSR